MSKLAWMVCGLLITSMAAAELTTKTKRPGYCTLWEHRDMQGARLRLPNGDRVSFASGDVGSSAWREIPRWNDVASSAKIDQGCRLKVWEHIVAQGKTKSWSGGTNGLLVNYVGDSWNDRISSATCYCD